MLSQILRTARTYVPDYQLPKNRPKRQIIQKTTVMKKGRSGLISCSEWLLIVEVRERTRWSSYWSGSCRVCRTYCYICPWR